MLRAPVFARLGQRLEGDFLSVKNPPPPFSLNFPLLPAPRTQFFFFSLFSNQKQTCFLAASVEKSLVQRLAVLSV